MPDVKPTYTGAHKIQPVKFEVVWAEGPINEEREGRSADTWEGFNAILRDIAATDQPPYGLTSSAYTKVGFKITFADGNECSGRYDVQNINYARPLLQDHVKAFVGFHSGLIKPDRQTDTDYQNVLNMYGEETRKEWYELARKYDVGVTTPDDGEPTAKDIDRRMVKALNAMEKAMQILGGLRRESGDMGPKLGKGERELHSAYAIISAKRPLMIHSQRGRMVADILRAWAENNQRGIYREEQPERMGTPA